MRLLLITFLAFCSVIGLKAQTISGIIADSSGNALPFVSVYVKNSNSGVSANQKGEYRVKLKAGNNTLVFSAIGFEKLEQSIKLQTGENRVLNVILTEKNSLQTLEVYANPRDIANEVMDQAREARNIYNERIKNVSFDTYVKIALEKEFPIDSLLKQIKREYKDSLPQNKEQALKSIFKKEHVHLIESISTVEYEPGKFRETVHAFQDAAEVKTNEEASFTQTSPYGEKDIAQTQTPDVNPILLDSRSGFTEFDFYSTWIDLPQLTENKLMSPMGVGSKLNYRYNLISTYYEAGRKIYHIEVIPLFRTEALFKGSVFIEDSTFALKAVDLEINPEALFFHKSFRIIQNYHEAVPGIYLPHLRAFNYTYAEDKTTFTGSTQVEHYNFSVNKPEQKAAYTDEVQTYVPEAFDRDSLYWAAQRRLPLLEKELKYIQERDSIRKYRASEKYNNERDSAYNRITFWDVTLSGVGYRNHKKNYRFYINPLISQMVFYGIGGYRHRLGGAFLKEFDNAKVLETEGDIDYGFTNKDVRGKLGIGLTYLPLKFVRTFIRGGDYYEMINTFASLGSVFSRSNFVRAQTLSVAQRMEVVNGLFAELSFEYSDQKPLTNLKLEQWSSTLFGELNDPLEFQRYIKSEIRLDVKYRYRQKFVIKKKKKIILGSKWPELSFTYRKGIPNLFKSEVNFDYIELGIRHTFEPARLGNAEWSVLGGTFFNQKNLRILEHKYFRGSDVLFFSDPTRSFQLLGPTLSTANAYLRANYVHQFNGLLLNKIPLLNRLKLAEAGGIGFLTIPEKNFAHTEIFFGLLRPFRIKSQMFRVGVFAVTADNTLNKATFIWKVGFQFFNTYTRRWSFT
ncbi:MAG: DUF5686 and carboxypeptidase regulatory-like domain-containing protein, partial [Bacteroidia bacterium]